MTAYASRTGTRRNLAALREAGWRIMVSATGVWRSEGLPYAIDNGAWTAHQQGRPFDADRFRGVCAALGSGADWIVLPDIVAGGIESLTLSLSWLNEVASIGRPVLLPVQDGMSVADVRPHVGGDVGIFLGGGTEWKERTVPEWGELARQRGCYFHVGRVNTVRRIRLCGMAGADSFDGTSASRYAVNVARLDRSRRQGSFVL